MNATSGLSTSPLPRLGARVPLEPSDSRDSLARRPVELPAARRAAEPAAMGPGQRGAPVSSGYVELEGLARSSEPLRLYHGGALRDVGIAWRLVGPASAPVVCALGGISGTRRVCSSGDPARDWWPALAGPGRPLDSHRFRILSFDYLGGSGDSAPAPNDEFPSLSSYDQAEALARVLDDLGLEHVHAVAGGSYGGMVALAFGERYPQRVSRLLVIGACDRAHPMATAWRSVQRQIVRFGGQCGRAGEGLTLARALAMSTYRSAEEFAARFSSTPARHDGRFVFPVEEYLTARGHDYAARFRPEAFLCLSESIDLHRVKAERICVPTTAVAFREDQLVPLADIRAMVARLPYARLHELSSLYGHDAFLKETEQLRPIFETVLGATS